MTPTPTPNHGTSPKRLRDLVEDEIDWSDSPLSDADPASPRKDVVKPQTPPKAFKAPPKPTLIPISVMARMESLAEKVAELEAVQDEEKKRTVQSEKRANAAEIELARYKNGWAKLWNEKEGLVGDKTVLEERVKDLGEQLEYAGNHAALRDWEIKEKEEQNQRLKCKVKELRRRTSRGAPISYDDLENSR
jgi:hypothetical protein